MISYDENAVYLNLKRLIQNLKIVESKRISISCLQGIVFPSLSDWHPNPPSECPCHFISMHLFISFLRFIPPFSAFRTLFCSVHCIFTQISPNSNPIERCVFASPSQKWNIHRSFDDFYSLQIPLQKVSTSWFFSPTYFFYIEIIEQKY